MLRVYFLLLHMKMVVYLSAATHHHYHHLLSSSTYTCFLHYFKLSYISYAWTIITRGTSLSLSISFPFSLYTSVSILLHKLFIIGLNYALCAVYAPDDLNCFFYLYQIGTFDTVKLQSHFRGHECFCSNIKNFLFGMTIKFIM